MKCLILLAVLFTGCAITIKPLPTEKPSVHHRHHKKGKMSKAKPRQTPTPEPKSQLGAPPYPPPNWDEIVRRTHPTPTISPYDFQ